MCVCVGGGLRTKLWNIIMLKGTEISKSLGKSFFFHLKLELTPFVK